MTNTTMTTASTRQTFALFCATGKDWRVHNLTHAQASAMLSAIQGLRGNKPAALDLATRVFQGENVDISTLPTVAEKPSFAAIYKQADKAGREAANACKPEPMVIAGYEHAPIMGGVCGFAWVRFPDGRKPFAKWLVKNKMGSKDDYRGGVTLWAGFDIGNQSMTIKEHYCRAFAAVCREHGIDCRMESRID